MEGGPRLATVRGRARRRVLRCFFLAIFLGLVRLTKGVAFADAYALISRPFWPGPSQKEWVESAIDIEKEAKLQLLEKDNLRLRELLSIQRKRKSGFVSAPVISRNTKGWWQQLEIGKGSIHGLKKGLAVTGPGGLLGIIQSITPITSRVRLLTGPGSQIGVWVANGECHGILKGLGTNRPQLIFFDKNPKIKSGDLVSTSPASTLLPPNIPVGVIQSVDTQALPAPIAIVQLLASPEAIDWVQIKSE